MFPPRLILPCIRSQAHAEVDRLRAELDGIKKRIRRLVTNLEAQEPDSEIADDIRARLEELAVLRTKKQQALEAAEKEIAQVPDPESAEALWPLCRFWTWTGSS